MPRDNTNTYNLPSSGTVNAGDVITASGFNEVMNDLRTEQNEIRTIAAGGTGASNASAARLNLGVTAELNLKRNSADEVPSSEVTGLTDALQTVANHTSQISALQTGKLATNANIPTSQVTNFATEASNAAPVQSITGTGDATVSQTNKAFTVNVDVPVKSLSNGANVSITNTDGAFEIASTNTTYSAATSGGLALSGTSFSVNTDLSARVTRIGPATNNYFNVSSGSCAMVFANNEEFRFSSDGTFHADGDVVAFSSTIPSDPRLKQDINPITDALNKVEQLNGYTYSYLNGKPSAGVLSTEVEKVLPSAVIETEFPKNRGIYQAVRYDQLHALLIEAVKELSTRVKELENAATINGAN